MTTEERVPPHDLTCPQSWWVEKMKKKLERETLNVRRFFGPAVFSILTWGFSIQLCDGISMRVNKKKLPRSPQISGGGDVVWNLLTWNYGVLCFAARVGMPHTDSVSDHINTLHRPARNRDRRDHRRRRVLDAQSRSGGDSELASWPGCVINGWFYGVCHDSRVLETELRRASP